MKITKLIAHFLLILAASNNNVNEANALPATTTASDHTFVNNKHHHRNTHRLNFGPNLDHRKYSAPSIREFGPLYYDPFYSNDPKKIAISFVEELHPSSDFVIKDIYKSDHTNVTHVYFKQVVNGLTVANGDLNVNVDSHGRVISFGDSFALPKRHSRSNQKCSSKLEKDNKNHFGFDDINGDDNDVDNMASNIQVNQQFVLFPSKNKRKKVSIKGNAELYNIDYNPKPIISLYEALKSFASLLNIRAPDSSEITISTSNWLSGEPVFLIANVPFALSDVVAKQSYLQLDTDYQLQLIWELQIEMEHNWYHAHIDARNGVLLALIDWVADAAYNVFPLGVNDPSVGKRELLYDPNDIISSPYGWHYQSAKKNFTTTIGNNVYAQENFDGEWGWKHNYRPDSEEDLIFDFPLDLSKPPKTYINASVTNLFYWNNIIHDLFYRYGFNEVAGNFQQKNHGKGGKDRDAVIANAQDGSGYNNANFATPPDGQHGKMRMYVWNVVNPYRDGDLESGIIVHEYSHGISTRLTGGPANSGCLGWGEAGGMGEGWGDFFATILRMKKEYNRTINFGMGEWANGDEGIRYYLYSTSLTTNPETYIYLDKPGYWGVHAKGAVWAEMLYEVYWNFVEKHGFTSSWFPPTDDKDNDWYDESAIDGTIGKKIPKHGNTLFLQLVVDGMKLQPCRPTFIDARDAILQADEILTGGQNKCEIWKGFAKRGLGVDAKLIGDSDWGSIRKENFDMPHACIQ